MAKNPLNLTDKTQQKKTIPNCIAPVFTDWIRMNPKQNKPQNTYHIIMKFCKLNFGKRENKMLLIRQKQFEWQWIAHQKSWKPEGSSEIFFKYWKKRTVKQEFYIDFWQVLLKRCTIKKLLKN